MNNKSYKQLVKNTRKNQKRYVNPIPIVIGLVCRNNKVLVVKNDKNLKHWQLIAGFINAGESAEEAIIRETFEETRLKVKISDIIGTFPYQKDLIQLIIAFKLKHQSGEPVAQDDVVEAKWVNTKDKVHFKKNSVSGYIYQNYKKI